MKMSDGCHIICVMREAVVLCVYKEGGVKLWGVELWGWGRVGGVAASSELVKCVLR